MEIKVNKEIAEYSDTVFWGLTVRQTFFSALAVLVAGLVFFFLSKRLGDFLTVALITLLAGPIALCGFVKYNGMHVEKIALCILRTFRITRPLHWKAISAYKRLEDDAKADVERERPLLAIKNTKE